MSSNVRTTFTSDDKDVLRSYEKQQAEINKLKAKLAELGQQGKRSNQDHGQGLGQVANQLKGVVAGYLSVSTAIQLVRREFTLLLEMQSKAAGEQITLASARKDVIRNMAGASQGDVSQVLQTISQTARREKIEERFIASAFASALSASGGNVEASTAAVNQAARVLGDKPAEIGGFAGSLLDLSSVTGTTDAEVNQGLLQFAGALSRVVEPSQQAQNIPRALIGAKSFGATPQEATALFASLTTGSGDLTGATSGTGVIALTQALEKAFPELGSAGERIAALQADPDAARKFVEDNPFEKALQGPIRSLLTDSSSQIAQSFASNLAAIPDQEGLRKIARDSLANFEVDPLEAQARRQRAFSSAEEQLHLANVVGAEGAINREGLEGVLKAAGMGAMATQLRQLDFETSSSAGRVQATEAAMRILDDAAQRVENPYTVSSAGVGAPGVMLRREPTAAEQEQATILRGLISELDLLRSGLEAGLPSGTKPGEAPPVDVPAELSGLKQSMEAMVEETRGMRSDLNERRPSAVPMAREQ